MQYKTMTTNNKMMMAAPKVQGGVTRNALTALTEQLGMSDYGELAGILKNTIMPKASDEEMAAFALVCSSYKLNPLTREVYAFPTKSGGIMPMIGIDGWLKIAHQHEDYAGMAWAEGVEEDGDRWCECTVWLKSTPEHPVTIREYLSECRQNTPVWNQRPKRMLRHRATIQAIRYALGISGVSDSEDFEEQGYGGSMQLREAKAKVVKPGFLKVEPHDVVGKAGDPLPSEVVTPSDFSVAESLRSSETPVAEQQAMPIGLPGKLPMFGEMV